MKYSVFRGHPATLILCCLFLTAFLSIQAQDKDWRPVTPEEIQLTKPTVEPDADAEAIFWEIRIDDSSSDDVSLRHYVRVKVFTERGREKYSKFDIPFVKGMRIKDLAARVIKADGSTVEIDKKDIFDREIIKAGGVKVKAKSFAVPNIEPGVIVEYRYRETIEDSGARGMRLAFQRDIPIQDLSYYYKPYGSEKPTYQIYNFKENTKFEKDKNGFWLARRRNVSSFREEPRMPPEDMVRPWMLLTGTRIGITSASAFGITFTIKPPGSPSLYWGGVSAENAPLVKFMNKSSKDIKAVAEQVTAGAAAPEEKLRKIYDFCQKEIQNTTFDTSLTDEDRRKLPAVKSISDVLKRRSASSQYIDMLFGAMANSLGMEARIAFSGNRSEMFFKPEMTNESLIHPAAVAVQVGQQWRLFNPGMKFLPFGMLVWYEEDTWALLISEKQYVWQFTPMTSHSNSAENRTAKFKLFEDGTLEGTVRIEYTGHLALNYRMENYDESRDKREENLKEELKNRISTAEVTEMSIENLDDTTKPLVRSFKVRIPSYAQKTGRRMFVQPGFFEFGTSPLFSSSARTYDVFFRYPWSETDKIELELPRGYALDNADAPGPVRDPQQIGSLETRIFYAKEPVHRLTYERSFHFGGGNSVLFPTASYPALKSMFDAFQKSDAHTISLRQAQ